MNRLLLVLALICVSLPVHAQYRCTGEDGIRAARDDDAESRNRGWTPRRWIAWCRACGGQVTQGRCVGPKLDGGGGSGGGGAPAGQARDAGEAFAQGFNAINRIGNYSTPNMAAQTFGFGMANGLLSAFMHEAMRQPTPQELAAREYARQEQIRLQQEAAERERQRQAAQHAELVGSLRGYSGGAAPLSLRDTGAGNPSGSNLDLLRRDGGAGVPLTPFDNDASRAQSNLAYLRRSEPETAPAQTRSALDQLAAAAVSGDPSKPFDSAATRLGGLPPPPPTPEGKPVGPIFTLEDLAKPGPKPRTEVARVLNDALVVHKEAETAVKAEVARLEKEPNRDPAKITQELEKLERIQTERKQIEESKKKVDESKEEMVDLSIKDLAGEATGGAAVTPSAAPAPAVAR